MSIVGINLIGQPLEEEAELARRAKTRDPAVWSAWHDQYYALIQRYAYSRLRSNEDAEEVASQVFLEAIKGIDRYSYRGRPILAWFYGIAHNLVARRHRDRAREKLLADVEGATAARAPDNEEATLSRLVIHTALEKLKPEHREVLVLRFLLELPTREVAAILGKGEPATYSLQVRATGALRRLLKE